MREMIARNYIEPRQEYSLDLLRPEDAEGVTRLFKQIYGDGYPIRAYVEPEKLIAENEARRIVSSVARTARGDIVGHNALYPVSPYEKIYESGAGVVHPLYRGGKNLFLELIRHGIAVGAKAIGLEGIFGEAVCNHVFTQKATLETNSKILGLEVDLMPAEAYSRKAEAGSRVSSFSAYISIIPKPQIVHLPEVYEKQLCEMYAQLPEPRQFHASAEPIPSGSPTVMEQTVYDFARVARITVESVGPDLPEKMIKIETDLSARRVIVIQLWLKLEWPWIGKAVDSLRSQGYFLGGILPRWFDRDGLYMQKIKAAPNWDGIQTAFDHTRRILDLVRSDWASVS